MYDFIFFTDLTDTVYVSKTIGAYKCAHVLREQGYNCLVVDHLHSFTKDEFNQLLDCVISKSTIAVGFSTTFVKNSNVLPNSDGSLAFTEIDANVFFPQGKEFEDWAISKIKKKNIDCKIIVGGTKVHVNYQNKNADYAIIGFSESSIVNLANHLLKSSALTNFKKNLWGIVVIDDRFAPSYDFKNSKFNWDYCL
jgi:hypothetical protein